jgi:putative mRNA 3-end processing factor
MTGVRTSDLLELTERGLYCAAGDFYVDPWEAVDRAVITHAHADHARRGSKHYLTTCAGETVLRLRMGPEASIQTVAYGESIALKRVHVSLHPAGHILGSAQVRIECGGTVCVVSGDFKLAADPTCTPFEPIRCHTFVTESTFGLPIYRWPTQEEVLDEIRSWWRANQEAGKTSLIFAYALGKAQRVLAGLEPDGAPVFTQGAVEKVNEAYRAAGVQLPVSVHVGSAGRQASWKGALVLAPVLARGTPWMRKFGAAASAFVSGWMLIRGTRRRRAVDRGFVLSDHADWPGLLSAIQASGAERVWVTHGYSAVLARWLSEHGVAAEAVATRFEGERDDLGEDVPAVAEGA